MRHTLVTNIAGNNGHLCHAKRPYFSVRHFVTVTVSVSEWTVYCVFKRMMFTNHFTTGITVFLRKHTHYFFHVVLRSRNTIKNFICSYNNIATLVAKLFDYNYAVLTVRVS